MDRHLIAKDWLIATLQTFYYHPICFELQLHNI